MPAEDSHCADCACLIAQEHAKAHRQKSLGDVHDQGDERRFFAEHAQDVGSARIAAAFFFNVDTADFPQNDCRRNVSDEICCQKSLSTSYKSHCIILPTLPFL